MIQQTPQQRAESRAEKDARVEKLALKVREQFKEKAPEMILTAGQLTLIDNWITGQNDPAIDRLEAIRRLVELGLKGKGK